MTLSRSVKQRTQQLRSCFRARQPCERNFKRRQELSTELDMGAAWEKLGEHSFDDGEPRHVSHVPRSDPVTSDSDANPNAIAILGAIPGLIQSLGIWTLRLDEIGRSMEWMESIPSFRSMKSEII